MKAIARLRNCPYSPQKMRLLADLVRGKSVQQALNILKFHNRKTYALKLEKLLLSAVSNWQIVNDEAKVEEEKLYIQSITVDGARMLKRLRPAPQGRAFRIRKRSNHVTVIVDNIDKKEVETKKENVTEE
jgi:large subunit ribosomal protein L22